MRRAIHLSIAAAIATIASAGSADRAPAAQSAAPATPEVVQALRQGGLVILMRHSHAPGEPPSAQAAEPDNPNAERQLDAAGKADAQAFGRGLAGLNLRLSEVWSSPAYRARQTVRFAGLSAPRIEAALGDGGMSMRPAGAAQAEWLRARLAERPADGANRLIVTHLPNIRAALGAEVEVADGETLILRPGPGGPVVLARMSPADWTAAGRP